MRLHVSYRLAVLLMAWSIAGTGAAERDRAETVIADSFGSMDALRSAWAFGYPWGRDHNGSARMDPANLSLRDDVLTVRATRLVGDAGISSEPPHLAIHYASAAIHARTPVLVDSRYPMWVVEGEFQVTVAKGNWPAFWLTPVEGWPPEADILEFKGDNQNWFNTFRTPKDVSTRRIAVQDAGRWHRYRAVLRRIDDRDAEVDYTLDGKPMAQHRAQFTGRALHLIVNLQMEGSAGAPGPRRAVFRARRVRVLRYPVAG